MKYLTVALVSALAALMVVACGGGEPTVIPTATPTTAAEPASATQPSPTPSVPQAAPAPAGVIAPIPTQPSVAAPAPAPAPIIPAPTSPAPVSGENHPPELASIGERSIALGSTLAFALSASDLDGDRIAFNVSPLPLMPGASLNASTGKFVFNPGEAQVGSFELTFQVSDGQGGSDSETVIITVEAPVAGGMTALVGRVLDANDFVNGTETPIVGATVSLLDAGVSAVSDGQGHFVLLDTPGGSRVFDIDAASADAAPDGSPYAGFREKIDIIAGARNVVDRPFFLPRIAVESLTSVDPGTTTVVTNESLGVTLTVPPNTAKGPDGSNFTGQISISLVPEALAPAALPENLEPGMLITLQPVGVTFATSVPITFPNIDNLAPGSETDLWSLDPDAGTFVVVGTGRVSADGSVIETISGGIRANDWHAVLPPSSEPGDPDGDSNRVCSCERQERATGSATAVHSGNLSLEHSLPDYTSLGTPRGLRLVYNSTNGDPQPIISTETPISRRPAVPPTVSASLSVAGLHQAVETFTDTSGLDETRDETLLQAVQFDASGYQTGAYPYSLRLTSNYALSSVSSVLAGTVLVNNQQGSPLGAGWTLDGLKRLHIQDDRVMVTEGDGSALAFAVVPDAARPIFRSPPGAFSRLVQHDDGTFTRTLRDGTRLDFNAQGLQTSWVDPNDNTTTYAYDSQGRLVSITDPVGLVTQLTYDSHLTSITDPVGRTTRFEHDDQGNLVRITDPDGTSRQFSYDARHRVISQIDKRGFTTRYAYDSAGRHGKSVMPDGSTREISSSEGIALADVAGGLGTSDSPAAVVRPEDAMATFKDGNGNVTTYRTNRFGSPTEVIDAAGHRTMTQRDPDGLRTRSVSSTFREAINIPTFENGNMVSEREAVGTPVERETRYEYHPTFNKLTRFVDPAGGVTTRDYDGRGNLITTTDALGGEQSFTYDRRGLILTMTDENGNTTRFAYDERGNLSSITDPIGNITSVAYDDAGNLAGVTEGVGTPVERTIRLAYDLLNRITASTDASGASLTIRYDEAGNVVERISPDGVTTTMVYDEMNRLTRTDHSTKGTTLLVLDANGNVTEQTDGLMATTLFKYDVLDQLVSITNPLGGERRFEYDAHGNLMSLQDALGRTTTFQYDILDRPVRRTNPLGLSKMLAYDSKDNVVRTTDPRVVSYVYDELSRLTQILPPGGTTTFTYDARGNRLTARDGDSSLSFTYDALNRVTEAATQDLGNQPPVTLTYDYDAVGNRRRLDDSVGGSTRYTFDETNRLTEVITPAGDVIGLGYDAGGRPSGVRFPNGVVSEYGYDAPGYLASISHTGPGDVLLASFDYAYNGVGNLLSSTEPTGAAEFAYDALRRVTGAGTAAALETYTYDAVGNRTASSLSSTHRYDDANRLLEDDDFTYTYDAHGNMATKTAKADGSVTRFAFGAVNRLVRIDLPDGTIASYRYDAYGRRFEKSVGGVTTRYVYDGFNILLEFDGANSLTARYSHGMRIDEPLSMERGGASYFYQTDRLGSTRIITDAGGSVINSYNYDAYGRLTSSTEGVANPFSYTGRERDAESGLYNYRARYYDPQTGRFISEDPVGLLGGDPNLFAYVRGNPVNFVDPLGIFDWQAPGEGGIAGSTGLIGGNVARAVGIGGGGRILAGRVALVIGGTAAAHVGLIVSVVTIVEAINEAGKTVGAWWGADRAEFQAGLAATRLRLFRTGRNLDPCDPDTPRLKRALEEYDKVLGDAITGRRSVTIRDLERVNELVRR